MTHLSITQFNFPIEQPMGAPSLSTLTQEESPFEGGATMAAKGKNLKGKGDTKVIFKSLDGSWTQEAIMHHNVTTVSGNTQFSSQFKFN